LPPPQAPAATEETAPPSLPAPVNTPPPAPSPAATAAAGVPVEAAKPTSSAPAIPTVAAADVPKGTISPGAVVAVVRAHAPEIQHCVEVTPTDQLYLNACESQGKTPAACRRARINLSAAVGPDGRVTQVSTSASREGTSRLEECIRGVVQSWTFPAPAGGVAGRISYPFIFE